MCLSNLFRLTETSNILQYSVSERIPGISDQKLNVALLSDEKQSQVTALSISVLGVRLGLVIPLWGLIVLSPRVWAIIAMSQVTLDVLCLCNNKHRPGSGDIHPHVQMYIPAYCTDWGPAQSKKTAFYIRHTNCLSTKVWVLIEQLSILSRLMQI